MWCPPTPPQDDNDIYVDYSLGFMYEQEIIPESQLPAIYVKKDYKRSRTDAGFFMDGRRPLKMRKEDNFYAPRSLFDRPSPALAKLRKDLKVQRYKGIFRSLQIPGLKQQMPVKQLVEPEGMAEWSIYEDMSILNVIQNLQGLPLNLMLLAPGHTPNWDLVAEIVNQTSRSYRSPKQCRYRYEAVIVAREEGKLMESPKKQKKNKNPLKSQSVKSSRSMRTAQQFGNDNNSSFSKLLRIKFENIKLAFLKKAPQIKYPQCQPLIKNPKHSAVLAELGITEYDNPPTPSEIAARRFERYTKEKQKTAASQATQEVPSSSPQQSATQQTPAQTQQQPQQPAPVQQQQQQTTAIVVQQHQQQNQNTSGSPMATIVQGSPIQVSRTIAGNTVNITHTQAGQQIVKALSSSPSTQQNLLSGTVQQITVATSQHQQLQQLQQQHQQSNTVSVVLTTPITTMSNVQVHQQQQQQQIVTIQQQQPQQMVNTSGTLLAQATSGGNNSYVQTITTTQSIPQMVSVATVNVITTAGLQTNPMTTLSTTSLRAQRIVTAPG
jgi:E1A-binding protein p400